LPRFLVGDAVAFLGGRATFVVSLTLEGDA